LNQFIKVLEKRDDYYVSKIAIFVFVDYTTLYINLLIIHSFLLSLWILGKVNRRAFFQPVLKTAKTKLLLCHLRFLTTN